MHSGRWPQRFVHPDACDFSRQQGDDGHRPHGAFQNAGAATSPIADDFTRGNFDKPFQTHGEVPPGVHDMQTDRSSISYRYEDLPQGGAPG